MPRPSGCVGATHVAPTGALPSTFGTDVWAAKDTLSFSGISGSVKFSTVGNRDHSCAGYGFPCTMPHSGID